MDTTIRFATVAVFTGTFGGAWSSSSAPSSSSTTSSSSACSTDFGVVTTLGVLDDHDYSHRTRS